jgi:predicted enzyme related to lactoylglutathione lyase
MISAKNEPGRLVAFVRRHISSPSPVIALTIDTRPDATRQMKEPSVPQGIKTILYPVDDITRAKTQFRGILGMEPTSDAPYYVGFRVGDQEIGLVPGKSLGATGAVPYFHVEDIATSLKLLVEGGAHTEQEIRDVGGGKLVATARDVDGNVIGLVQDA